MTAPDERVQDYLLGLEPEWRAVLEPVLHVLRQAVPAGYEESVSGSGAGMVTWSVPLERLPRTYNGQPLQYLALAAQKRHCSVYLMGLYADPDLAAGFERRWTAGGRTLDMGKSCLRFRRTEDLDLPLLADAVASVPVDAFVRAYELSRSGRSSR